MSNINIKILIFNVAFLYNDQGYYCPEGTSAPEPCPPGTYSSRLALSEVSECSPCGGGQYCSGVGLSEPSGSCDESYYCKEGAQSGVRHMLFEYIFQSACYLSELSAFFIYFFRLIYIMWAFGLLMFTQLTTSKKKKEDKVCNRKDRLNITRIMRIRNSTFFEPASPLQPFFLNLSSCDTCATTMFRLPQMGRQEVCVLQEVTVL